jgi:hypothetical protein
MEIEPKLCETDSFIKKKRSLNIVSILLIFIYFSGATISSVSMQGANLTIQNPQMVNIFLFIMLVYFLYRYWLDTKNNKHHIRNLQAITVSALLTKYIKSRIGDRVNFYIGGFKIANPSKNSKAIILNFKQTNPLVFWKNIDFKNVKISNIDKEIEQKIRGLKTKSFYLFAGKHFFNPYF